MFTFVAKCTTEKSWSVATSLNEVVTSFVNSIRLRKLEQHIVFFTPTELHVSSGEHPRHSPLPLLQTLPDISIAKHKLKSPLRGHASDETGDSVRVTSCTTPGMLVGCDCSLEGRGVGTGFEIIGSMDGGIVGLRIGDRLGVAVGDSGDALGLGDGLDVTGRLLGLCVGFGFTGEDEGCVLG